MARKVRIGRPPRADGPTPTTILLAAALKDWLREQAELEGRGMGAVVEDGLRMYQTKVSARAKTRRNRGKA